MAIPVARVFRNIRLRFWDNALFGIMRHRMSHPKAKNAGIFLFGEYQSSSFPSKFDAWSSNIAR